MNFEEFLKEKENLMIRFLKLTEEALQRVENKEEEQLPEIMEKRENLIKLMENLEEDNKDSGFALDDQGIRIKELKARLLTENKHLLEEMERAFASLKEEIGKNKKAIKINKAYLTNRPKGYYLNEKN